MKKLITVSALLLTLVGSSAFAADVWTCDYKGTWTTNAAPKGAAPAEFKWHVVWTSTTTGWTTRGEYDDAYGHSVLDGTCANKACTFTQKYAAGELANTTYYWTGTYTDEVKSKVETVNRFKGTWGMTLGKADGGWDAVATCKKN